MTQILSDNKSWALYGKTNAITQISKILTNQRCRKRREGETGCNEEKDRKAARGAGSVYLKNTLVACVSVCVFSENVAGGHFSISNPISLKDPVSVAADCWSPLEPCDRAREGAAAPYWPFIWTHRGHIASL